MIHIQYFIFQFDDRMRGVVSKSFDKATMQPLFSNIMKNLSVLDIKEVDLSTSTFRIFITNSTKKKEVLQRDNEK